MMAEARQCPAVKQQRVIIANKQGNKLVGILHESGTSEIVILCHGLRSSKEDSVMVNLAAALEKSGISCFRFDFTGNGESEGTFEFGDYWRELEDLHSVIQHFQEADRAVGAIIGHSKGANVVLLYASKYHDIMTVVNVSGLYVMYRRIEDRFGKNFMERIQKDGFLEVKNSSGLVDYVVTEETLMERLNINMLEECRNIDNECRFLTIHGSLDEAIPVEDAFEFAKILPNHKLHIIEGADHVYTEYEAELTSVVVNYIRETLQLDKGTSN